MLTSGTAITSGIVLLAAAASLHPVPVRAGSLRIVDARGDQVGTLAHMSEGLAHVVLETAGGPVNVPVGPQGFLAFGFTAAVFASDNCSGPPRVLDVSALPFAPPGTLPLGVPAGVTPENKLVIANGDPGAVTAIESIWMPQRVPSCESSISDMFATLPTIRVLDLAPFVPPFHLAGVESSDGTGAAGRRTAGIVVSTDGAGQPLGPVAGGSLPFAASILFDVAGRPAPVTVIGNGALAGTAVVVYAANNCTGPPFLLEPLAGSGSLFPLLGVAADGKLLTDAGPAAPLAIGSSWSPLDDVLAPCALGGGPAKPVRATVVIEDLSARPTPFRLDAAAGGPDGPPGDRGSTRGLRLEDAAGQPVGLLTSTGTGLLGREVVALVRPGRQAGEVTASSERFLRGTLSARFETAGCGGPLLVETPDLDDAVPLYPPTALGPGNVLYAADGAFDTATLQFRWDAGSATCLPDPVGPTFVRHTSPLIDLSRFALPLRVR